MNARHVEPTFAYNRAALTTRKFIRWIDDGATQNVRRRVGDDTACCKGLCKPYKH